MRTLRKLAIATAAAALAIVASPAWAAAPYTVTAGTQTSGSVGYDGAADGIGIYTDYMEWSCDSGSVTGDLALGTSSTGAGVASIADSQWNDCLGPLDMPLPIDQIGSWNINVLGDSVGGVTDATITNINMRVAHPSPGTCAFTITGTAGGFFDENTQQFTIDDLSPNNDLVISDVTGCFNLVYANDAVYFAMTYDLSNDSDGDIAIASS